MNASLKALDARLEGSVFGDGASKFVGIVLRGTVLLDEVLAEGEDDHEAERDEHHPAERVAHGVEEEFQAVGNGVF